MCKSIKSNDRIIIFIILLIVIIPIFVHQIKLFNDRRLKKTVNRVVEIIEKDNNNNETIKYTIDNKFLKENNISRIKGKGIAFVDSNNSITVVFGYKDKCAIKFSFSDKVYLENKKCDNYELIRGIKSQIVTSGDGLYQINDSTYRYQGYNVNNYLKYNNVLWRIMEINNSSIKIVSENVITSMKKSDVNNYLNNDFYESLNKDINKKIELLSINDVINSSLKDCKIGNYINCPSKSYLVGNATWLMNTNEDNGWYLYTDGNIYPDSINNNQDVRAVVYLNKNIKVINGMGTIDLPFTINETILDE